MTREEDVRILAPAAGVSGALGAGKVHSRPAARPVSGVQQQHVLMERDTCIALRPGTDSVRGPVSKADCHRVTLDATR